MTSQNQNRLLAVGALLVASAALAFIAWGNIGDNLVYYWTPNELLAQGEKAYGPTIRLGGVVAPGSIQWNAGKTELSFEVAQDRAATSQKVKVHSQQIPPEMFRDGIGVVVEGTYDASHLFKTSRLMVNHSNEYRPPKPGEDTKAWQQSLADSEQK